jgi:NOL1/NOP2/fmu family ribosome biogenesis protein
MLLVQQKLRIVKMGTRMGELTRKGLKWSEEIALCTNLNLDLPFIEMNRDDALKYLKCDTFPLAKGEGMKLVKHEGFTIGALKQIGNRFNTFWPKEWRIRQNID